MSAQDIVLGSRPKKMAPSPNRGGLICAVMHVSRVLKCAQVSSGCIVTILTDRDLSLVNVCIVRLFGKTSGQARFFRHRVATHALINTTYRPYGHQWTHSP